MPPHPWKHLRKRRLPGQPRDQNVVHNPNDRALSSAEAELTGLCHASGEGLGLQSLCRDLGLEVSLRVGDPRWLERLLLRLAPPSPLPLPLLSPWLLVVVVVVAVDVAVAVAVVVVGAVLVVAVVASGDSTHKLRIARQGAW